MEYQNQSLQQLIVRSIVNDQDFREMIQTAIKTEIADQLKAMNLEKMYYTPGEVAERLKIKKQTLYGLIRQGHLKSERIGRTIRISYDSLQDHLFLRDRFVK
ncbi:MAG TPA: helix-turn-helix domain-containing protein [Bacteroidales bacterium]|nr:helix-turn-helix domain-containing protein [Bacteroidales bacterium]